jgi:ADP-ribose pyrophosphatase YjhB (NUDIX family)
VSSIDPIRFCPACGSAVETRWSFGRERPVCPSCGRIHFVDPKVAAAVLVEHQGKILLCRRGMEPAQGSWTLPAGFVDADEDPRRAAERECLEETALTVRAGAVLEVIGGREHPRGASIVIVYQAELIGGEPHAGDDVDQVGFFAADALPALAFAATRQVVGAWRQRAAPGG